MLLAFFAGAVKLVPIMNARHFPAASALALTLALLGVAREPVAAKDAPEGFAKWEETIAGFEAKDRKSPPPKKAVLFIGSSSIRMWNLPKSFPGEKTLNRGFVGSEIVDSTHFAERIIFPYQPRQIVFYAGDNDIAKGKSAKQVAADFRAFVETVRAKMPDVPIAYVAVKPSIARWKLWPVISDANAAIRQQCEADATLTFIDVAPPMLDEDGKPKKELFLEDGLHMNAEGYAVWNALVKQILVPEAGE